MAPRPDYEEAQLDDVEAPQQQIQQPMRTGDEILISGVSGTFPESENVSKLMENLFNEVDMVNDDGRRWKLLHPEIPQRTGKLKMLEKFDAQFFGVHYKLAWPMDPMCRMLLENVYQAVIDAGVSPKQLRQTKTGVFVGSALSESEKTWFYSKAEINGFGITGCSRAMLANRLSYWLGTTGPSFAVDASCSSSMIALEQAYVSMRNGSCDAAIVAGCNLCLHPYTSFQYSRMDVISPDGISKSFDKNANGWARSEAIGVLFLQKAKDARRVYAEVVHVESSCDSDDNGDKIFYQTAEAQKRMLSTFYKECNVSPRDVEYIEAHGTGLYESDGKELTAMGEFFCKDRDTPLMIGSVKSNLGHSEPSSGICALAKMCICYDSGYIPKNLHFSDPREDVPALLDGRMAVVTKKYKWNKGYAAVNSLSLGGVFVHALLKNFAREKGDSAAPRDDLPRLVTASGRSDEAVKKILDEVESRPIDVEHIRLLHAIHEEEIKGHVSRGYTLIETKPDIVNPVRIESNCEYFPGTKRPVWFIYSGMGSQWAGMGAELMRIPIFAAAIEKCHQALAPKGIDIVNLITSPDTTIYNNILHSFIGIAAVQIGLTDVLYALGIQPDYIIGHSVGELGCAYADGCFTAEQMILSAYSRGLASIETPFIRGSMAAIGLGYQEVKKLCPPEIEVACHNGPTSSTISGPADIMKSFVAELVAKGIFAKEVPCSNIAYHSRYIAEAGPTLLKYLKEVLKEPKERSPKWVSTSVPQPQWKSEAAQFSSAEYHTNNLLCAVLFEETSRLIPYNAITIEIAPHGLLQAILNRSMKKDCTNIALTKRGHPDNVQVLLTAIGKLYQVGLNPKLANLYPQVEFPVSAQTPMLSHLVEWEHSESWFVGYYTPAEKIKSGERVIGISLADDEYEFLSGHIVDGINTFPEVGYLVMVWESIGKLIGVDYNKLSVMFTDIQFKRKVKIIDGMLEFQIAVHKGTGNFEIMENEAVVVTGRIFKGTNISGLYRQLHEPENGKVPFHLTSESIYKEFELRGYNYKDQFKSILSSNVEATKATVKWNENWITYLDSLIQLNNLSTDKRELYEPLSIAKLSIDVDKHREVLSTASKVGSEALLEATNYVDYETIRSAGTEIQRIQQEVLPRTLKNEEYNFSKYEFVSHFGSVLPEADALSAHLQIVFENVFSGKFNILEVLHSGNKVDTWKSMMPSVQQVIKHASTGRLNVNILFEDIRGIDGNPAFSSKQVEQNGNIDLLVGASLLTQNKVFSFALNNLKAGGFILSLECCLPMSIKTNKLFNVISAIKFGPSLFYVLMRKPLDYQQTVKYIRVSFDKNYSLIKSIKEDLKSNMNLVLVSENDGQSGLLGFLEQLRKDDFGDKVRGLIIDDVNAPTITPDSAFYNEQMRKNLFVNVYCYGQWGSYHRLSSQDIALNTSEHAYLVFSEAGNNQNFQWLEGPLKSTQQVTFGKKLVHVYNSGLTYRDVLKSTGQLPLDEALFNCNNKLGFEYAGRTSGGERVMGLVQSGGLSTLLEADEDLMWQVPSGWSLEDAATVPAAYAVAYLALVMRGYLYPGNAVLIHSGAGSVGQAAINICIRYNCEIFTTVGTKEKKEFLRKKYPQIKESHIGSSRDTTFADMVRMETKGKGVTIVLNSLADDKFQESLQCLGFDGRLMHIGLFDFMSNAKMGMNFLIKQAYMRSVFLDTVFRPDSANDRKKLHTLISEGIANGEVQPLNRAVFETDHVDDAFRYLSSPRHIGKVLIKYREDESQKTIMPTSKLFNSAPRYICNSNESYLVVGDLSGAALEMAEWLIQAGATNIILQSSDGNISNYCPYRIRLWQKNNVSVHISTSNITTIDGCINLLNLANNSTPLRGLFFVDISAGTHSNGFETLSPDDFKLQYTKRPMIAKQLDMASRNLCSTLKDFVIITTLSDSADVATSLSLINQVCEDRVKVNLPAIAVHLKYIEDNETKHGYNVMESFHSILESLPGMLLNQYSTVIQCNILEKKKQKRYKGLITEIAGILDLGDDKKLKHGLTFRELQVNVETAVQIRSKLQQKYCLFFTLKEVLDLSIRRLREIEAQGEDIQDMNARVADMALFVKKAMNEMDLFQPFFDMCTMTSDGADSAKYEDELVEDETAIILIPGMDGFTDVFAPIAKYVKMKAYGLVTGYDHPNETVEQTSERLAKNIKTKLAHKGNYFLCGYSYGALLALEVAASLEKDGRYGKVFCIDGSPEYLKSLLMSNFSNYSEHGLQNVMLSRIFQVISPVCPDELNEALTRAESWDKKVEIFLKISSQSVSSSEEYRRYLVNTLYRRLSALSQYNSYRNIKLKSQVVLICDKNNITDSNDYGLSKMTEKPVKVYTVEGNHINIIDNILCSKIINNELAEHLDDTIINPFIQYNPM